MFNFCDKLPDRAKRDMLDMFNAAVLKNYSPVELTSFPEFIFTTDATINPTAQCFYCGNTGTNVNVRGGLECAGCGAPR